jgi:predicted amidohydrolase
MEVCFVPRGGVEEFCLDKEKKPELILFGFQGLGEVSYEKEIDGTTNFFEEVARLSKQADCVVVSGCVTNSLGHKRKSAVIAEKGRILGVSDMLNALDDEVGAGAELRVYPTTIGRIGLIVAEDLYFPDVVNSLTLCGAEYLVCPFSKPDGIENVLCRAFAFCYGSPVLFCGVGYSCVADSTGCLAFSAREPSYAKVERNKEYHLVGYRRRAFLKRKK